MARSYVLLTAAKNEADFIAQAIESVLRQTYLPLAWFIMDDGSTDRTAQIVEEYAARHSFIRLHAVGVAEHRNFGAQYKAIKSAYEMARELDFGFIGVQDADIAVERADYYERILMMFGLKTRLGVAGGYIYERTNGTWRCRRGNSPDSVAGGIQMFRRACFEQIGGYTPLYFGGSDWLAQLAARMAGWEVMACPEFPVRHYRPTSSADGRWRGLFRLGMMDGSFGSDLVFEFFKCCRRITARPVLVGGALRFFGYLWWKSSGRRPLLSAEQVAFLRNDQTRKVVQFLRVFRLKSWMQSKQHWV